MAANVAVRPNRFSATAFRGTTRLALLMDRTEKVQGDDQPRRREPAEQRCLRVHQRRGKPADGRWERCRRMADGLDEPLPARRIRLHWRNDRDQDGALAHKAGGSLGLGRRAPGAGRRSKIVKRSTRIPRAASMADSTTAASTPGAFAGVSEAGGWRQPR
jgi:hypothetical protein